LDPHIGTGFWGAAGYSLADSFAEPPVRKCLTEEENRGLELWPPERRFLYQTRRKCTLDAISVGDEYEDVVINSKGEAIQ
jgi:hypothetical protein